MTSQFKLSQVKQLLPATYSKTIWK